MPPRQATDVAQIVAAARACQPRCGEVRLICVDGPAGAGKTTLAAALSHGLGDAPVVHLDDLFQGWAQDLGSSLSARIEAWLLAAWADGLTGMHLRYDWGRRRFVEWVAVPPAPFVVLEGCGSGSRPIRDRAGLLVWVTAPPGQRLARGLARDGEALREQWLAWQEHEAAHFATDGTQAAADLVWTTGTAEPTDPSQHMVVPPGR